VGYTEGPSASSLVECILRLERRPINFRCWVYCRLSWEGCLVHIWVCLLHS